MNTPNSETLPNAADLQSPRFSLWNSPLFWGVASVLALMIILALGFLVNTHNKSVEPGKSDSLVHNITEAATEVVVLKSAPNPDGQPPRRFEVGRLRTSAQKEEFLSLVRLQDNALKPFERASNYRLRFYRNREILGAMDIYFNRGWAYAQEPKGEPDAPFEQTRVWRPTFGPRMQEFLESLERQKPNSKIEPRR